MKVCDCCFNDIEMQAAIRAANIGVDVCDVCGRSTEVSVVDDLFSDFFEALFDLFVPSPDGQNLVRIIQSDWNIFSSEEVGKRIVSHFLSLGHYAFSENDKVVYNDYIIENSKGWDRLKSDLMERYRYATNISDYFDPQILFPNVKLPKDTILYRSRIIPEGKKYLTKKDMGCPPSSKAKAGRANPLGIPYLYLCRDEKTTYFEVRALYLDNLCIGEFKVKKDLKILSFCSKPSLFFTYSSSSSPLADEVSKQLIIQQFGLDLSKPLRRFDTELEYVPTQYICEYCKLLNGIDGIQFNSSLHEGGINVVLFDDSNAECVGVKKREITKVDIDK